MKTINHIRKAASLAVAVAMMVGLAAPLATADASVANTISFQGRLLSSPTTPAANQTFQMRLSLWSDADFVDGVDRSAGTGALSGAAWQEVQTFTTDTQGFFLLQVGSIETLPEFDSAVHRYLQAEVKSNGAADTSYFLLDNMSSNSTIDRKSLINSAYAQNAKRLDGKKLGFDAGDIPYLNADGKIDRTNLDLGTWHNPVATAADLSTVADVSAGSVVFVTSENSLYTYDGTDWTKVGSDLTSDLGVLTARVTTNETSISTNTSDIASNLAAIQSNDTDIATNAAGVASNLSAIQSNDTDIAANVADIAANLAAIQSNDTDVAANLAAILGNDTDIATNATGVAANLAAVLSNDTDIATNVAAIAANLAAIQSNDTDVAANLAAIQSNDTDIAENLAAILSNNTDIATNLAAILSNDTDIAANLAAIQSNDSDISQLQTDVANRYTKSEVDSIVSTAVNGLSWKAPVADVAALSTTYTSPVTGDTAYVTGVGEIYTWNGTSWVKTGADFFQNATTTAAGIVQLATDGEIAANKAVQSNDSRLAQVAVNTTNITANASAIAQNASDVSTNAAAISTNATDIATNAAGVAANLSAIQSNDADIAQLQTDTTTNASSASQNAADITALNNFVSTGFDVFILPQ